jgi:uncharacterized protein (DUF697 family)
MTKKTEKAVDAVEAVETPAEEAAPQMSARYAKAEKAVKDHMLASLGIGLLPVPVVDLALFMGSGIYMVKRLSAIYDLPFKGNIARGTLAAIAGSLGSVGVASSLGLSLAKLIPGAGTATALITLPIANAAFTYAAGKVFIAHFEAGGTLLDFDPKAHVDYLKDLFEKGKGMALSLRKKKDAGAVAANDQPEVGSAAAAS